MVPRALAPYHQPISSLTLHAFGDASAKGVSAAVYAIVHQDQGVTQQLVCAKLGLAKKNLTIPRLELVAGHMAVNLVTNVQAALNFLPHETHCWFDSTVALYWIKGQEEHRQLNLQYSDKQVLECRGRIIGEYPIYLSDDHPFIAKLVFNAHLVTLHEGIGLTIGKVREKYWVPRLRRLVKKLRGSCYGCKRFRARAYQAPPPGNLPKSRSL